MIPLKDENPGENTPWMTIVLIGINLAVYIYQMTLPPLELQGFILSFGMIPAELLGRSLHLHGNLPGVFTLITSQFVHGSLLHLLGNMLYLWIFGNNIEDLLGKSRFVAFYLLCGVFAALAHIVLHPNSTLPMVGASGAIAGVLGAYLITFPGSRVLVLIFIIVFVTTARIPAYFVLGFWFLMQLLYATSSLGMQGTNIAYMAHVGGFLVGLWLVKKMRPNRGWRSGWR